MKKSAQLKIILVLALLVALTPTSFMGFPAAWENVFVIVAGAVITILSFLLLRRRRQSISETAEKPPQRVSEVFIENGPRPQE